MAGITTFACAVEVVIEGQVLDATTFDRVNVVNTAHYYQTVGPGGTPRLSDFLASFKGNVAALWAAFRTDEYTVSKVSARWMNDSSTVEADEPTPGAYSGTRAGDYQPPEVSAYISWITDYRGRQGIGSMKLGPVMEADTTAMRLSLGGGGGFIQVQNIATALRTVVTDTLNNYLMFVFNQSGYVRPPVPGPVFIKGVPITNFAVRRTLGRMAKRRPKYVY